MCMKNTRRSEVRRALRKGNQTPGTKPPPLAMLARHVYEGRSHAFSVACVCCESRVGGLCGARKRRNRRREPSPATEERGNAGKAMQLSNQVCTFSFFFLFQLQIHWSQGLHTSARSGFPHLLFYYYPLWGSQPPPPVFDTQYHPFLSTLPQIQILSFYKSNYYLDVRALISCLGWFFVVDLPAAPRGRLFLLPFRPASGALGRARAVLMSYVWYMCESSAF